MLIRPALPADVEGLRAIRNHYITASHATFDEEPLSPEAVELWFRLFGSAGPHRLLVAEGEGRLLGFAGSQPYRNHPAFRRTVETSIYVAPGQERAGVGSALYAALFLALADTRLHRAVAGIALPNEASLALHRKAGFTEVGIFSEYAVKRGQYLSSIWMQRALGPG